MYHETQIINSFIEENRRERYLMLINSAKGRAKLRAQLAHLSDLEAAYVRQIAPSGQNAANIINQLKKSGAPDECYITAEHPDYDQKLIPLQDAFAQLCLLRA